MEEDVVNHPSHYEEAMAEGYEPIDFAKIMSFARGSMVKYISRGPHKGTEAQDYRKAAFYARIAAEEPSAALDLTNYGDVPTLLAFLDSATVNWGTGRRMAIMTAIIGQGETLHSLAEWLERYAKWLDNNPFYAPTHAG